MIKINLLGAPKPKRGGKRVASTTITEMTRMGGGGGGEGPSPLFIILGLAVLALAAVAFLHYQATAKSDQLQTAINHEEQENRRLAAVKAKYDQEQRVRDNYERRGAGIYKICAPQTRRPGHTRHTNGDTPHKTHGALL